MDTDESGIIEIEEVKESVKGARDVIKIAKRYHGVEYAILAVENQEGIHYGMPVRVMGYDYYTYNKQYQDRRTYYRQNNIKLEENEFISGIRKTDRFLPVVTLVLYYGEEDWDGPTSLHDMLDIPEEIRAYVGDYPVNIIQVKESKLKFHNQSNVDLFKVLSILYDRSKTKEQRNEELRQYEANRAIDEKVIDVIAATTNIKIEYNKVGERNVCTLWDEVREEGREEGRVQGAILSFIELCCQKYKKGLSPEIAAEHLERSVEDISKIYEAIEATGGDSDEEKVYYYLVENSPK